MAYGAIPLGVGALGAGWVPQSTSVAGCAVVTITFATAAVTMSAAGAAVDFTAANADVEMTFC